MRKWLLIVAAVIGMSIALIFACRACIEITVGPENRTVKGSVLSPDGRFVVYTVYCESGGPTASVYWELVLHDAGSAFDVQKEKNLIWTSQSLEPLRVFWVNPRMVHVVVSRTDFQRDGQSIWTKVVKGISVTTEVENSPAATPSQSP